MNGIDFSQYPVVDGLIHECDMEQEKEHILWLQSSQSDAAVLLAEMHLMCKAAISKSIPLRNQSKVSSNYYYSHVARKVHVFAAHQALSDLNMTEKELSRLFAHKDVFGRE